MKEQIRSAEVMTDIFKKDSTLLERLKQDPIAVLEEIAPKAVNKADAEIAFRGDKLVYRIAVTFLGTLTILAAGGSIALIMADKAIPEALVALGSAAVGGLVGLFAQPPNT